MGNYGPINSEYVEWCTSLKRIIVLSKHQLVFFKDFLKTIYTFVQDNNNNVSDDCSLWISEMNDGNVIKDKRKESRIF